MSRHPIRLLILTGYLTPPVFGGAIRMINPIIRLGEIADYEVTYLFAHQSNDLVKKVNEFFAPYPWVRTIGVRNNYRYNVKEREMKLEIPGEVFNYMELAYYMELKRLLQESQFDLVQVASSWMSWSVPLVRTIAPNVPVILDMQNIEATVFKRWIQFVSDARREEMTARWEKTQSWEKETWGWYDACLAVSRIEMQAYREHTAYRIPAWELPSSGGIDLRRFPRTDSAQGRKKETVLWLGMLGWPPNVQGLIWFLDEVMPLLVKTHPNALLYVAGAGTPPDELLQRIRTRGDVIFLGEQDDELSVLKQSEVFVVPLWIGAGARIKIPTAWAAGIPVVATIIGAEGLDCTDGENILLADDPGEFARMVARLMDDATLAQRLTCNGRAAVEERHSLEQVVREYDRIYNDLVDRVNPPAAAGHADHKFGEIERAMRRLIQLKADIGILQYNHSLGLRMLRKYASTVNRLLPQGTKRRGFYEQGLAAVRTIIDEGWRSFFKKAMQYLFRR